jgi:hypothetical protein
MVWCSSFSWCRTCGCMWLIYRLLPYMPCFCLSVRAPSGRCVMSDVVEKTLLGLHHVVAAAAAILPRHPCPPRCLQAPSLVPSARGQTVRAVKGTHTPLSEARQVFSAAPQLKQVHSHAVTDQRHVHWVTRRAACAVTHGNVASECSQVRHYALLCVQSGAVNQQLHAVCRHSRMLSTGAVATCSPAYCVYCVANHPSRVPHTQPRVPGPAAPGGATSIM